MNPIDELLRAQIALYLLECARVSGVIIVAPLSWTLAPTRVKVGLVLVLAFIAHGMGSEMALPRSSLEVGAQLGLEFVVGLAMGLVVRMMVALAEICGEILSPVMGLGVANVFDPTTQSQQSVIATILRNLFILIALVVGVHRVLLEGLLVSFRLVPVGEAGAPGLLLPFFVDLSSRAISGGLRVALPLVAVLFMTQVALAFIARAAPQMQVFNVGFAVLLAVGLTLLGILLPDTTRSFVVELSQVGPRIEEVLSVLGGSP